MIVITMISGCASLVEETTPAEESIPPWVMNLPTSNEYFYAVGIAGPTYFYEDGVVQAADAARVELAKAISSHVQEVTLIVETNMGINMADETHVLQALSSNTNLVIEHSEIVATWVDSRGVHPGGKSGVTYVLARIPKVIRLIETETVEPNGK